ncbi:dockerin type I repeat-containing protein [Eubacterium aggregans]|uniref:dockerin type I repeat-containing protein n=1 Tax=Eubacterium aggregans TaxID=81409 RepID=UPI003F3F2B99
MDWMRAGRVIKDGDQVSLYKANGEALNMSTALGTGMIIKVNDMSYTIIIYGDVNGDGQINMMDVAYLRDQIYGIDTLDGPFYRAMDVNHDNRVNLMDLAAIRDAIYEVDTINQNV